MSLHINLFFSSPARMAGRSNSSWRRKSAKMMDLTGLTPVLRRCKTKADYTKSAFLQIRHFCVADGAFWHSRDDRAGRPDSLRREA